MSDTVKIKLADASTEQLRWFAGSYLNLEVSPSDNANALRVAISRAWDDSEISVPSDMGGDAKKPSPRKVAAPAPGAALAPKDSSRDPRVTLIISRQDGPGGDRPVEVGVNGTLILIPRGEPSTVAYRYYEALKNAVQTVYEQTSDGDIIGRDVHTYPFQVTNMPSEAAVQAWLDGMA